MPPFTSCIVLGPLKCSSQLFVTADTFPAIYISVLSAVFTIVYPSVAYSFSFVISYSPESSIFLNASTLPSSSLLPLPFYISFSFSLEYVIYPYSFIFQTEIYDSNLSLDLCISWSTEHHQMLSHKKLTYKISKTESVFPTKFFLLSYVFYAY